MPDQLRVWHEASEPSEEVGIRRVRKQGKVRKQMDCALRMGIATRV